MKGAQDVRNERKAQIAAKQQKKDQNVEIIESLVLDKFRELEVTTVKVWVFNGFFAIDDDETDIPFDEHSMPKIYKDFNDEEGYRATYYGMYDGQKALEISIID